MARVSPTGRLLLADFIADLPLVWAAIMFSRDFCPSPMKKLLNNGALSCWRMTAFCAPREVARSEPGGIPGRVTQRNKLGTSGSLKVAAYEIRSPRCAVDFSQ